MTTPRNDTVVWNLMFLVVFFTSLCLAARYPTKAVRNAFVSISALVFIFLLGSASLDLANQGPPYEYTLSNRKRELTTCQVIANT